MWGGRFSEGPSELMRAINASIGFDKRLWRQDIAASRIHIAMLAAQGIVAQEDADAIEEGLDRIEDEYETRRRPRGCGARGHPHACRAPPRRIDRPGGGPAPHRPLAQRPGRDRLQALGARRDRRRRRGAGGAAAGAGDARRRACRHRHAGLHPSPVRPAGDARPPSHGLLRDAAPRPLALRRRPRAAQRMPAGRRRSGRHQLSDRPRGDRVGARFRPARRQFARRGVGPGFRARLSDGRLAMRAPSVAPRRGARAVGEPDVRLRHPVRRFLDRLLDHAAEAQSRRRRAGPRP